MKFVFLVIGMFFSLSCVANSHFSIHDSYARATPPGVANSAVFGVIKNSDDKVLTLVSAESNVAKKVELHTVIHNDGMMKMRQIPNMKIPPNGKLILKPGGFHIMLLDVYHPLHEGENIDVILNTDAGEQLKISVPVKKVLRGMNQHN